MDTYGASGDWMHYWGWWSHRGKPALDGYYPACDFEEFTCTSSGEIIRPIGTHVWDGKYWLLDHRDESTRKAYMTTMVTWLTMEWPNLTLSFLQQVYTVVYDVAVREAMYKDLLALFHVFLTTLTSNLDIATVELSLGMMVQLQTDSQVHLKYPVSIGFLCMDTSAPFVRSFVWKTQQLDSA